MDPSDVKLEKDLAHLTNSNLSISMQDKDDSLLGMYDTQKMNEDINQDLGDISLQHKAREFTMRNNQQHSIYSQKDPAGE